MSKAKELIERRIKGTFEEGSPVEVAKDFNSFLSKLDVYCDVHKGEVEEVIDTIGELLGISTVDEKKMTSWFKKLDKVIAEGRRLPRSLLDLPINDPNPY